MRIITDGTKLASIKKKLQAETGWEKPVDRRKNQKLIMIHKIVHKAIPVIFAFFFQIQFRIYITTLLDDPKWLKFLRELIFIRGTSYRPVLKYEIICL